MSQTVKELRGDMIMAADGRIGLVDDVYFDDERWGVRYFVVDTGGWLPGKRVLISPASVDAEASGGDQLRVRLTREQVEKAPDAESDRPVSRQYEMKHAAHFGYPYYWGGPLLWGMSAYPAGPLSTEPSASPGASPAQADVEAAAKRAAEEGDAHLRSGLEVIGYDIEARVRTTAQTGVEMEALTAVAVAALTIYDMVKAVDKSMVIGDIRLMKKTGGKSGTYRRSP